MIISTAYYIAITSVKLFIYSVLHCSVLYYIVCMLCGYVDAGTATAVCMLCSYANVGASIPVCMLDNMFMLALLTVVCIKGVGVG